MDPHMSNRPVPSGLEDLLEDHFSYLETRGRRDTHASTYTATSFNTFDSHYPLRPAQEPLPPPLPLDSALTSDTSATTPDPDSSSSQPHSRSSYSRTRKPRYIVHLRPQVAHSSDASTDGASLQPHSPPAPTSVSANSFNEKQDDFTSTLQELEAFRFSSGRSSPLVLEDDPPPKIGLLREICFIAIVACSHLMTQAALGQALAPMAAIGKTFGTNNLSEMTWFVACYSLTVGTFILVSGRVGDILGHKKVFVIGYFWLGVWAAFCGFAAYTNQPAFFDVCRAMQGIGPALLMPNGLAMFGRAYPIGIKKNIVFSIFGAVAPMGFVIGSCSGSLFASALWWPWSFWSYGITACLLGVFALLVIPPTVGSQIPNPPSFDTKGAISGVTGLVLVNIAWNQAPMYGWSSPHVYFLLIIGLLVLAFFFYIETRVKDPLLPIKVLNGATGFVLACVGLGWGAFSVWLFYTYRFLLDERGLSPLAVTARFAPAVVMGLLAAGLTGALLTHTPVSFTMMISMMAFCIGCCIGGTAPVDQTYWAQTFVSIVIMPFGMDMSFPAATVILSNSMPKEHQGLAASLVNTVVNYSIATALGIAGTVEINASRRGTGPPDTGKGIQSGFYTAMGMSGVAVLVGVVYFVKTLRKEGWKVMEH